MAYVGIDLHTNNMVNVALNGNGKVVREAKLPTATRSLEDFFNGLEEPIRAVVECTSNWYWLSDWCRTNNVDLTLAHAKMVKAISYAKVKTDTVDARTLAEEMAFYRSVNIYTVTYSYMTCRNSKGAAIIAVRNQTIQRFIYNLMYGFLIIASFTGISGNCRFFTFRTFHIRCHL